MRNANTKFVYDSPLVQLLTGVERIPGRRTSQTRFHLWAMSLTLGGGTRYYFPETELPDNMLSHGALHLRRGDLLLVRPGVLMRWETPAAPPLPLETTLHPSGAMHQWEQVREARASEAEPRTTRQSAPFQSGRREETVWEVVYALFEPRPHWMEWLSTIPAVNGVAYLRITDEAMFARLRQGLLGVHRLYTHSATLREDWGLAALERVLLRLHTHRLSQGTVPDARVRAALKFLHENYSRPLCVQDVAHAALTTESNLFLLFRNVLGTTPMQYLDTLRMERAVEILRFPHARVAAVAAAVGFTDPDRFTLHFRRHTGQTPREFRRAAGYEAEVKGR